MDLTLSHELSDTGRFVISLVGALDLTSRSILVDAGSEALADGDVTALVLNLSQVDFMDSSGIGAIVEVAGMAQDGGRAFALQDPSKRVSRILELTGLTDTWQIEASPAA